MVAGHSERKKDVMLVATSIRIDRYVQNDSSLGCVPVWC